MSVLELPVGTHARKPSRWARMLKAANDAGPRVAKGAATLLRAAARPAKKQLADHAYTFIGLGLFDSAMFVHSLFTGLMVTGITFLLFELKVAE